MKRPETILNWVGGEDVAAREGGVFPKTSPHNGEPLAEVARSGAVDIGAAVVAAQKAQPAWAATPAVRRGEILFDIAQRMQKYSRDIAEVVALETGKSMKDALGETGAAIQQAFFMAGEGQRFFGRTTGSGVANRHPAILREPMGVCGLLISFNTPIANIAWKVFPALICGNAAVLKASEFTPLTAWAFSRVVGESQLPPGTLNIVQGLGQEAGDALVRHKDVSLISFTGSSTTGRTIATTAAERLAKVFLELGGKNPMVICDDADLNNAVKWALLSSFSNAGQRCAASSRLIVFDSIYERFRSALIEKTTKLKVGPADDDDFGPVINEKSLETMLATIDRATQAGAKVLTGGARLTSEAHRKGSYLAPTLLEGVAPDAEISCKELFGPVACLYRVKSFEEAVALANRSEYGLTSAIHTRNYHRAHEFARRVQAGVASINAGTHGSEPHMPFGGVKSSGMGGREPGPEALDVYSNLKVVYHNIDPTSV